jgi:uncharacterized protein with PIN domain
MGKYNPLKYLKKTKARTTHQCNYCGSIISPQEYYFRETMQNKFLQSLHARIFCSNCYEKYGENLVKMKKTLSQRLNSCFGLENEDEDKS